MIYPHFVCFFIRLYDNQKKGRGLGTVNKRGNYNMSSTQNYMSSQSLSENHIQAKPRSAEDSGPEQAAKELLEERVAVETKSKGMFGNFLNIASQKTYELYLSIIGDYHYVAKNEFSYRQKVKILSFLQAKVLTINAQVEDQERIRFADFDPEYLAKLPQDFEQLRNRILKARTNLDAAKQSLEQIRYSSQHLKAKYLNEQAFEFQRMKNNSICWGLFFGAFISATIYRRANIVRKTALFVTLGHVFGVASHRFNIDRYFDSVYPIFREEAIEYAKQEKEEFQDWKPQGKAVIEE